MAWLAKIWNNEREMEMKENVIENAFNDKVPLPLFTDLPILSSEFPLNPLASNATAIT